MGVVRWLALLSAITALGGRAAHAQGESEAEPKPSGPAPAAESDASERELADQIEELREQLEFLEQQQKPLLPLAGKFTGYLDFGLFATTGDGSGIRRELDFGDPIFPEFDGITTPGWVFLGDPLSTAVNSRGEPADTGVSRQLSFDSVNSQGHTSFIVNALHLGVFAAIGESLQVNAAVDFVPRSRNPSDPDGLFLGDYLDVKLAYAEYRLPIEAVPVSVFAGKFDSVLGIEYRSQESPDRLTVTPSLICRYTCGHPLGIKLRATLLDESLNAVASVTNGSHFWEGFNFAEEIASNNLPTFAGRLGYRVDIGSGIEIGASGAWGAQDAQPNTDVRQWHVGADLHAEIADAELSAEYVRGRAKGQPDSLDFTGVNDCTEAPCLKYQGAYGLFGYRVTNNVIPYVRVDWRDALHRDGVSFVYISKLVRATPGVRLEIGAHVIIKAEYTVNTEVGRIPEFPNDVFTTSLVIKY